MYDNGIEEVVLMEKKWFAALLMVVVMVCACWMGAVADEECETFTSGDYRYVLLDDGTVEITRYTGRAKDLIIADMIDGKKVTAIGDSAFAYCLYLTNVTIPDSVTSIGNGAFEGCWILTSVLIPDSIVKIGTNPFSSCNALESISVSVDQPYFATIDGVLFRKADKTLISYPEGKKSSTYSIPQGITNIGDMAFFRCDSLTNVNIPDSVTSIGNSAFSHCESLISVTIPDSVTSIGDSAFFWCSSLTRVTIPDSVAYIGVNPFRWCKSLESIFVSPDNLYFAAIDGVLFHKVNKSLIAYPAGIQVATYIIPQGITSIGNAAFSDCSSLTSVTIPDSVTSIGDYAFSTCNSLTSVTIPDSVTSIGQDAFKDCPNLTLTVPRNSYAAEYAKTNNIPYNYSDANDWLNN